MYPVAKELDDIYYRVKRDNQYVNICLSDLTQEEREEILSKKPVEYLYAIIEVLISRLRELDDEISQ